MTGLIPALPQTELDTTDSWQQVLSTMVRDPEELFSLLKLDKASLPAALAACQDFPLRVPRPYIARMRRGDFDDPLLKQVLPLGAELDYQPGFTTDPLEELARELEMLLGPTRPDQKDGRNRRAFPKQEKGHQITGKDRPDR